MKRREAVKLITIAGVGTAAQAQHPGHQGKTTVDPAADAAKKAPTAAARFKPRHFTQHEYATVSRLADMIIPRDQTPGALDAKVPEYIDLQVAEMPDMQVRMSGGIQWLDRYCGEKFGKPFVKCTPAQQKQVVDGLAYRKTLTPELKPGRAFFTAVRDLTCDGFYSSKQGFAEVGYKGNGFVRTFEGCNHPEHG